MTVSVLVPWRADGAYRDAAWTWVRRWWADRHPGWQVVEGRCPPGPWRKALAVADALTRADGDVLVVADADVVCDGVQAAVDAVVDGTPWAVPHLLVHRLSEAATAAVLDSADLAVAARAGLDRKPYRGVEGGGIVVLRRATYRRAPLDPRFETWGQDDESWALALSVLAGRRWRGSADLWHLWHPPAPRLNRHVGNASGRALHVRYQYAANTRPARAARAAMARLVAEHRRPAPTGG